jgi:peptide/nickel transport system substrate-binding protein/oligopeptide transport system substrate-binding protein
VIPSGRWLAPVAVLATVVLAAGCGSGSSSSSSATSNVNPSEIPNGGTLNWPLTEPVSMTPLHGQEDQGVSVEKSVFAGLVDYDPKTLATVPSIATSWEHNANETVFTFHLRSGVKFQPGQNGENYGDVTADTFVQDWGIACAKGTASEVSYILQPVKGFDQCANTNTQVLSGVKALNPTTLQVTLSAPFADFPGTLGHPVTWAFPPQLARTPTEEKAFEKFPVGAGPFQFVSFVPNKSIVIKKFPGYFGTPAHLNEVSFQIYPSSNEEAPFQAFKSGQEDYARIPTGQVKATQADPTLGPDVQTGTELSLYYYGFQLNGNNELAHNKTLRQALAWGTNSPAIVNNINEGIGTVADGLVPPGIPGFKPGMSPYHYDPSKAAQLVKTSGDPNPSIELSYNTDPGNQRIAEALAQGYEASGFKVKISNYDWGTFLDKLSKGQLEFWRLGWLADYPLMDNFLFPLFDSKQAGLNNYTFYNNPKVDAALLAARAEPNAAKRYADYNAVGKVIMQDVPEIPIYYYGVARVKSPQVINFQYDEMGVPHFAVMGVDRSQPHT